MQIIHFDSSDSYYQDCLKIRYEILRKPLGMEITEADKAQDKDTIHILALVNGQPAGTVSLYNGRLRQMAVLNEFQGLGIGAKLVAHLEEVARSNKQPEVGLDARFNAIPFYEKLGYVCYSEVYEKIGIPHRKMVKTL